MNWHLRRRATVAFFQSHGLFLWLVQKFVDKSKLKRHALVHTGEKHFFCPYDSCGKVGASRNLLYALSQMPRIGTGVTAPR